MQKTIYIPIDTTLDNTVENEMLVKRGDILTLTIKVFIKGALADLTGQSIDLILRKSDGTLIEKVINTSNVANGVITATLSQQATLVQGLVSGEVQLYTTDTLSSTNTFTFNVSSSIADDVLEVSQNDIQVLADLRNLITSGEVTIEQYKDSVLAIGNSIEAVQALANIKLYIDTNLPALESENAKAVVNIVNEKVENDRADINIVTLGELNNNAEILEQLLVNLTNENTKASNNISSLENENTDAEGNIAALNTKNYSATNNINNLETENVRAEANIVALENFGDATQLAQDVNAVKTEVETARNGEVSLDVRLDKNDTLVASHSTQLSDNTNKIATLNGELTTRTIYVATTGNDTTGDGTSGKPFLTINKAISTIKKNIQSAITVSIADGTYNEDVSINGFYGITTITIKSTSGTASNCIVKSITVVNCTETIVVNNITFNTTTSNAVYVGHSSNVAVAGCVITASASQPGIYFVTSIGTISSCTISNRSSAIWSGTSRVFSNSNSGTGNTIGLSASDAGTIGKWSTQPSGTTAESSAGGGVIR